MLINQSFMMDVSRIELAHEFVIDRSNRCEYPNGRGSYGVVHCLGGDAEFRFKSGARCSLNEGETLLLSPCPAYSVFTQGEFKHFTVNFTIHDKSSRLDVLDRPYCHLKSTSPEQFSKLFGKLTHTWSQKSYGFEMLSISYLYAILSLFYFEHQSNVTQSACRVRLEPVREWIRQHGCEPITLEGLARLCNMSVTNFRREWQKLYHTTPMQYRDSVRLSFAKEYLISGYYSVEEVAARCGFDNASYFIRFFQKHVGTTPGAFKKQAIIL